MTTLEKLQHLSDGEFHSLCDDLLRRLEPRYRRLRSHGINPLGVSIKGQPDSYVGETANTCTIAFQYSVDRGDWWNKVISDVNDAVSASPGVQEIVVATPRNIDREGPKDKSLDWLSAAKAAAGKATLQQPYDGRDIARLLDAEHQDLRYEYLRIPYSRLSGQSILASCREANDRTIAELTESGRYDPTRYSPREADRRLFGLWQRAMRPTNEGGSLGRKLIRLIALVNDSGVGKTSLLAAFIQSFGFALPAVLIQARDLAFASEESLVAHVIHTLLGVLDPSSRQEEEAAVAKHLAGRSPLTVVLDGLDEAEDAELVRRAVNYWLKSKLGQMSVLVVSSRPEFWKACVDRGWSRWMPRDILDERAPAMTATGATMARTDPTDGVRLPDRFTEREQETAWVRAGRSRERLFALPAETREELRHPFTLRIYLDLLSQGEGLPRQTTRADLLEAWLNRRLDAETVPRKRLSRHQFRQALILVATRLAESGGGSLSVDDLSGVPRFDPRHPPGPVVERLLAANILESVPGHPDRIRFAVEAVQDFYQAEAEVEAIAEAPAQMAERFANLRFSDAYPRLARIGQLLTNHEARHQFMDCLADADPSKAAVVLRENPSKYQPLLRQKVVDGLGLEIASRHRVRGAFAIHLLSDLDCEESKTCLATCMLPPARPHPYLMSVAAVAFAKLSHIAGIELVYGWPSFGVPRDNEAYYFKDMLGILRGVKPEFKAAMVEHASSRLEAASGSKEHARAVCVLAYLSDERLGPHLDERLTENGALLEYENHALIALGTEQAGEILYRSAILTAAAISELGYEDGGMARHRLHSQVSSAWVDHQYLYTPEFEPHVARLIHHDDEDVAYLGHDLAMRSRSPSLFRHAIQASAHWKWTRTPRDRIRSAILPDTWLGWWKELTDVAVRRTLLHFSPVIPNAEIERILTDCLDSPDFRFQAAWHLGHFGCYRSATYLRQALQDSTGDVELREKGQIADALGWLRDQASVEHLRELAVQHLEADAGRLAVLSLGFIGTPEAEEALRSLLDTEVDEQHITGALVNCGSPSAVSKAIEVARSKPEGPKWLCRCIGVAFSPHGHHVGEYYTHVSTTDLVDYLASGEGQVAPEDKWGLVRGLEQVDSEEVRGLLRQWASRSGTPADSEVRADDQLKMSHPCYDELMHRGDVFAIPYFLDYRADENDDTYVHLAARNLSHFPSNEVAKALRGRLACIRDNSQAVRLLSLLGRFGDSSDEQLIRPYLDHPDDLVANVACESLLRLTDPMLVPEKWREI